MPSSSLSADAFVQPYFTVSAYILAVRWSHHRTRDHFGPESDLYVMLSTSVGKYIEGTPVHWVLADMVDRITAMETSNRVWDDFDVDAFLAASGTYGQGIIEADAVIKGTYTFDDTAPLGPTIDAVFVKGFTVDARLGGAFTVSAFVI